MQPRFSILAALALLLPLVQVAPANAQPLTVELAKADGIVTSRAPGIVNNGVTRVNAQPPLSLAFTCTAGADCTKVKISFNLTQEVPTPGLSLGGGTVTLPSADTALAGNALAISYDGVRILATTVQFGGGGAAAPPPTGSGPVTKAELATLIQTDCPLTNPTDVTAACTKNCKPIIVRPSGAFLSPRPILGEENTLRVYVLADRRLSPFLVARRKSAQRNVDSVSLVGSPTLAQAGIDSGPDCTYLQFDLSDFAPGSGDVEIVYPADATLATVGSFSVRVDRVYSGRLSFGPVYSGVGDKTFKLVPGTGTDKRIVAADSGDRQVLNVVFLTPFIHGKHTLADEEKLSFGKKINPTVGLSVNNFSDHILAGLSFGSSWIQFSAGAHYARINRLIPNSGLREGSSFTGAAADLPTEKHWKAGAFAGVSLDLRIATQLLKAVSGVGK